jgi:uncharacterized membrane protein YsdA (DUF1294 family)/cold shock CspA family protein
MAQRSTRVEGTLTTWTAERGFGFITPSDPAPEIFAHISSFGATATPQVGLRVSYEIGANAEGKPRAERIMPLAPVKILQQQWSPAPRDSTSYLAIPAFLALGIVVAVLWQPPLWVLWLYLGMSVLCFGAYGIDKRAAVRGRWRIPESSLLLPGLLGGWPGAIIGQQVFRHKTKKAAFVTSFWTSVVLNVILFVLLCSPPGQNLLRRAIESWMGQP